MAVSTKVTFEVSAKEIAVKDLGTALLDHVIRGVGGEIITKYATGTAASTFDLVYSNTLTLAATSQDLDLAGSLSSELTGATITMVELCGIVIVNKSTVAGEFLAIGGAAAPLPIFSAGTDEIIVGPSGVFFWLDPIDGIAVGAGATDDLKIDAGANTITFDILLLGRSA